MRPFNLAHAIILFSAFASAAATAETAQTGACGWQESAALSGACRCEPRSRLWMISSGPADAARQGSEVDGEHRNRRSWHSRATTRAGA